MGCLVHDILAENHRGLGTPNLSDPNGDGPKIITINCPVGDAEHTACHLHSSTGYSGVVTKHLKSQLLKHGKAFAKLREELVEWALWLANTLSSWAAYHAMHQGCVVALDKQPGAPRHSGDGKANCKNTQLCADLEVGIEGVLHTASRQAATDNTLLLPTNKTDDDTLDFLGNTTAFPPYTKLPLTQDKQPPP
ncbi:LOW QUALITY PROTEIN: hypothetical protein ACHAW6_003148 [Cyclotella cf. meneghiniana]